MSLISDVDTYEREACGKFNDSACIEGLEFPVFMCGMEDRIFPHIDRCLNMVS